MCSLKFVELIIDKQNLGFLCVILFMVLIMSLLGASAAYLDGTAKANWLKKSRDIDIPWHEATWLNVNISSVDTQVKK